MTALKSGGFWNGFADQKSSFLPETQDSSDWNPKPSRGARLGVWRARVYSESEFLTLP